MKISSLITALAIVLLAAGHALARPGQGKAVMPVGSGPFTFGVISDCRSGDRVYKKIAAALAQRKPDFVIHVGDVLPTYCNREQWENFVRLSEPIKVPFYMTPGNHDIEDEKSQACWKKFVDLPGKETYYKFTAGDNLFVVLNSSEPGRRERVTGEQFAWLERTLDPKKYSRQFVFVHHPLFHKKSDFHYGESIDKRPEERDRLHRLFVEKGVDIVFHGHEHGYRRQDIDGVRYIIAAGAGSPVYHDFNHFVLVTVDGGTIKAKVIDRKGVMRDSFVMFEEKNRKTSTARASKK